MADKGQLSIGEIPVVVDESMEQGRAELREGDTAIATLTLHPDGTTSSEIHKREPSPREVFLQGVFETWGYSKAKARAAAHAAMEKLA